MAQKGDSSDLMMKFVLNGSPTDRTATMIAAESTTKTVSFDRSPNPLLKGFKDGYVFEVDEFSFKVGTIDDSQTDEAKDKNKGKKKSLAASAKRGGYQEFRAGRAHKYPVDLQPVTFTRAIDAASSMLIQNCIDCTSYDSATIIKRKATGGLATGEVFLRLDFVGVLVTKISWENDDQVKESCEFVARSVTVSYRPQLPDGTLGAVVSTFWGMTGQHQVALV
jgi:type VI protein secretion system component Hcp